VLVQAFSVARVALCRYNVSLFTCPQALPFFSLVTG